MEFMIEFKNLKESFKESYDKQDNTIDEEDYHYIQRTITELIRELKNQNLNLYQKFMIKNQLQSIGLKTALAKRVPFNPFSTTRELNEILKYFKHNKEAKIIGVNKKHEIVVITKNLDMNKKALFTIKLEKLEHVPYSTYQTEHKEMFKNKLISICKETKFKFYDHYNNKYF